MPTFRGEKRSGSARVRSRKGNLVYEEDWEYLVQADSKFDERHVILATSGLPRVNQTVKGNALCKALDARRMESQPLLWDVTASFSSEVEEGTSPSDPNAPDDPALWVPVRETIFEKNQRLLREDKVTGLAITNSAGMPYETALMEDHNVIVWEFWQFDTLAISDEIFADWNELVNENVYKTKAARTLLLCTGKSTIGFYYGFRRRLSQLFLKYDPDTWYEKIPDVGTHELIGGVLVPIIVGGDLVLKGLDGAGEQVADGDPPFIQLINRYDVSDFAFLRI